MKQAIGKFVEREADVMEATGQSGKDIGELAAARGFMRSDELIIGATNLFVKLDIRRAAQTTPVRVFVKNAADKERIISDMGAEQESLLRRGAGERDEHIGNVFMRATPKAFASPDHFGVADFVRAPQLVCSRKSFEE